VEGAERQEVREAGPTGSIRDPDTSREIRLISYSAAMDARLVACLARRGIPFTPCGVGGRPPSTTDGRAPLDVEMRFDAMVFRCVAKIAFNYMAAIVGADFARSASFDVVREFIRNGTKPKYPIVVPHARPILFDDSSTRRQTSGHLLTVRWERDSRGIVAQVSLFNETTYDVMLTRNYDGVWRDIHSGHRFGLKARRVSPLVALPMW
jgi:hypothetical protein